MKAVMLAILLISLLHLVQSQVNPAFTQSPANANQGTSGNIYYLVSNSDCNGAIRELFLSAATIKGTDPASTRQGPTSCTIRLQSTGQYDTTVLDIEVKSMNIQDCTTQASIYDGDGAQQLMMTYDCRTSQNVNRKRFITSGNTATFMMTRQNINSVNFDIEIIVTPTRGGVDPGDTSFGSDYYFDKFTQNAIVGIIGAFYAIVLVICAVIIYFCSRNYWGLNKEWETHQLATVKTGTTLDTKRPPSNVWSVEMKQSQGRMNQYPYGLTSKDARKNVPQNEDGDSGVFYNDDVFQKRRLMNDERDKAKSKYVSSNASFTEPEDDPNHFKEKIIAPRLKSGKNGHKQPSSHKDIVSDHTSDHSSDQESEVSRSDSSVTRQSVSSGEDKSYRSRTTKSDTPSDTESEVESGSDDRRSGRGSRSQKRKKVPHKIRQRNSEDVERPSRPNRSHQQPLPPPQMQQALPQPQMQQIPYGTYGTQFVPMMAGHPHLQPVPMVQYPPTTYLQNPGPASLMPQVQPTQPPIYSYLVRRGYVPHETHSHSPASTVGSHRSGDGRLEEPELRLDSGVEYMRR